MDTSMFNMINRIREKTAMDQETAGRQQRERHAQERRKLDNMVDNFALTIRNRLHAAQDEGKDGWDTRDEATARGLLVLLEQAIREGDLVDMACYAAMLYWRGESFTMPPPHKHDELTYWRVEVKGEPVKRNYKDGARGDLVPDGPSFKRYFISSEPATKLPDLGGDMAMARAQEMAIGSSPRLAHYEATSAHRINHFPCQPYEIVPEDKPK